MSESGIAPLINIFMTQYKILSFLIFLCCTLPLHSQETTPVSTKVFLDCSRCNNNFIKQETDIVDFVRDRKVADIHLLISDQPLASGGRRYKLNFIGLGDGYDQSFSIELDTYQTESDLEVNQKLSKVIKAGLMPFLVTKGQVKMEVSREEQPEGARQAGDDDPWDFWVFEVGGNFNWEKESNQSELELEGDLSVERTTEEWRIRSGVWTRYEINRVNRGDEFIVSSLSHSNGNLSAVKSLGKLWSAGLFSDVFSNTYNNINIGAGLKAALEYNLFPYRISATKEFTIAYMIGPRYFNYIEETIYDKQEERLFQQALRANLRLRKQWGTVFARLEGSQYFHDLSKNRVSFDSRVSFQVIQGLFLRVGGRADLVHDQLFLPKGEASLEEVLLNRRALATNFEIRLFFGVAYTFGSIYNSIVNTRL